jgi:hypothetical protein
MANFKKVLNKKIIFVFVIVLILFIGAIIYGNWKIYQNEKRIAEMPAKDFLGLNLGILPKGFTLEETLTHKILKSEDIGISFSMTNGWEIFGYMDNYIDLKDPNFESDSETFTRVKGCKITMEVKYFIIPGTLSNRIKGIRAGSIQINENEDILEIDGHDALKITESDKWLLRRGIKKTIEISIPLSKADIYFSTAVFQENDGKCEEEFDQFLETVSIK